MSELKIILGDIVYPKSEGLVIPANLYGIMRGRISSKVVKAGWKGIEKEAKEVVNKKKLEIGDFFVTGPGRLKRRGVKKIYHSIVRRLPGDFTSINIVQKALSNVSRQIIKDKISSVTFCGIGIECGGIEPYSVAMVVANVCNKLGLTLDVKIIDDNEEFINGIKNILGIK